MRRNFSARCGDFQYYSVINKNGVLTYKIRSNNTLVTGSSFLGIRAIPMPPRLPELVGFEPNSDKLDK